MVFCHFWQRRENFCSSTIHIWQGSKKNNDPLPCSNMFSWYVQKCIILHTLFWTYRLVLPLASHPWPLRNNKTFIIISSITCRLGSLRLTIPPRIIIIPQIINAAYPFVFFFPVKKMRRGLCLWISRIQCLFIRHTLQLLQVTYPYKYIHTFRLWGVCSGWSKGWRSKYCT